MERHVFDLTEIALDFIQSNPVSGADAQDLARLSQEDRQSVRDTVERVFDYFPEPREGETNRFGYLHRALGREMLGTSFIQYITNEPTPIGLKGVAYLDTSGAASSRMHRRQRK